METIKEKIQKLSNLFFSIKNEYIYIYFFILTFLDVFIFRRNIELKDTFFQSFFLMPENSFDFTNITVITIGIVSFFVAIGIATFQDNYDYGFRSVIISERIKLRDLFIMGLLILGVLFFGSISSIFFFLVLLPFLFWNIFAITEIFKLQSVSSNYFIEREKHFEFLKKGNSKDDYRWDQLEENIDKMIVDKNFLLLKKTIDIFKYPVDIFYKILFSSNSLDRNTSKIMVSKIHKGLSESFDSNDYKLFEDYYRFTKMFFRFGKKYDSPLLLDRSWRYGRDYLIRNFRYKKSDEEYNIEKHKKISEIIFRTFSHMLKEIYDSNDFNDFKKYSEIIYKKIIKPYIPNDYNDNFINDYKDQMFFGLVSWFIYKNENQKDEFQDHIINLLIEDKNMKVSELTSLFVNVLEIEGEHENKFGWDYWYMDEHVDEGAFSMRIHTNSKKAYLYILENIFTGKEIDELQVKNLDEHVVNNFSFVHFCKEYLKESNTNIKIKKFFEEIIKNYDKNKNIDLDKAELSKEKIISFKKNIIKNFDKYLNSFTSNELFNKYINTDIATNSIDRYEKKSIFIDTKFTKNTHYVGFDEGFNFGRIPILELYTKISEKLKDKTTSFKKDNMHLILDNILDNKTEPVIITFNGGYFQFFYKSLYQYNFKHSNNSNNSKVGVYKYKNKEIDVYNFPDTTYNKKNKIFVLDKNKLGNFYINGFSEENITKSIKVCKIEDIDNIKNWGESMTKEKKEELIKLMVNIKLTFYVDYKNDNEDIGWHYVEN